MAGSIINKIKALLEIEVKLDQVTTANGVVLEADVFEQGAAIFIVPASAEDERVPVPVGEYELEGGEFLVVAEEGIIQSIGPAAEAAPEDKEQGMEKEVKKTVETVSKETHFSAEQKDELKEIFKSFLAELEEAKEEVKEEVKKVEEVEVKAAEVVEPIKHSPEKLVESKRHIVKPSAKLNLKERIKKSLSDTVWNN